MVSHYRCMLAQKVKMFLQNVLNILNEVIALGGQGIQNSPTIVIRWPPIRYTSMALHRNHKTEPGSSLRVQRLSLSSQYFLIIRTFHFDFQRLPASGGSPLSVLHRCHRETRLHPRPLLVRSRQVQRRSSIRHGSDEGDPEPGAHALWARAGPRAGAHRAVAQSSIPTAAATPASTATSAISSSGIQLNLKILGLSFV